MTKAVYPGSFDPMSNGHLDIIKRISRMFDEVHVLVSYNMFKHPSFSVEERINMAKKVCQFLPNVIVKSYDGLVVNYCKDNNIHIIVRGMRNYTDYESEFSLFQYNRDIYPDVETIIMLPTSKNQFVSSSAIKELVTFGVDIKKYVPKEIHDEVVQKFKNN